MRVDIYTDGSCKGDHRKGFGGWAFAVEVPDEDVVSRSGGVEGTTSNRMELTAVLEGLVYAVLTASKPLKDIDFVVFSDSAYVVNVIEKGWLFNWAEETDWQCQSGEVANQDLWKPLYYIIRLLPNVEFVHIKAHTGIELNELCDELAGEEAKRLQDERETPDQAERRRHMNQKTKTQRKATFTRRPLLRRRKNEQQLKETDDIHERERYGRSGIDNDGD